MNVWMKKQKQKLLLILLANIQEKEYQIQQIRQMLANEEEEDAADADAAEED